MYGKQKATIQATKMSCFSFLIFKEVLPPPLFQGLGNPTHRSEYYEETNYLLTLLYAWNIDLIIISIASSYLFFYMYLL